MANKVYVTNRSVGLVVYNIPDMSIRREFNPNETKEVLVEEIKKLSYQPGGKDLIENFLYVHDDSVINEIGMEPEQEYYISNPAQVAELIKNGSLDEFLDCLDFAPQGVIDLVKKISVELPIADYNKRKALKDKLGFDIDGAIAIAEEEKKEDTKVEEKKTRRVNNSTANTKGRRTSGSKYKVVDKK